MTRHTENSRSSTGRGRSWLLYPVWILVCGIAFSALKGAPDPASPTGRIAEREAIARAEVEIRRHKTLNRYQAVHASWSSAGELGEETRWVILFKPAEATGLQDAVVVELGGEDGCLIRMRGLPN